jgi:geranylgeranyl pyrophosphate synthase
MLTETLTEGVPTWEPQRHLYGLVKDFIDRSGKGLRPALIIATARAPGGRAEDAFPAAAGLEMLHNAFLVHDDIEDGSDWRRGVATMHRRAGIPIALNTGDSMNALAMRLFRKSGERLGPVVAMRIFDEVDHMLRESLEGQALELGWIRDGVGDLVPDDYLRLVLKKTAWYSFIHPMRIGSLVAGTTDDLDRFNRFGFLLGAAFQIQDDLLNLVGAATRYGKEIGGDLWEGKRSLVVSHAFAHAGPSERARLESFFSRPGQRRLEREMLGIYDLLHEGGSIEWARRAASQLSSAAQAYLPTAFAGAREGPDLDFVRSLVAYVTEREV